MNDIQVLNKKLEKLSKKDLIVVTNLVDTLIEVEKMPNEETIKAIQEMEKDMENPHRLKKYSSFAEVIQELEN